jgi:hypothetical protein
MLDSGASSSLIQSATGFRQTGPSDKQVITASSNILQAANKIELDIRNLLKAAKEAHVVPTMTPKALMSVKALADSGHTTIFHPYMQGVTVHVQHDISLHLLCRQFSKGGEMQQASGWCQLLMTPRSAQHLMPLNLQ